MVLGWTRLMVNFWYISDLENKGEIILWSHDHRLEVRTWMHREANESLEDYQRNCFLETQEL